MASTLTKILLHVTFSTKGRANLIPAAVEADLYAYIGGVCRNQGCVLMAAGGTGDHVHLLMNLAKTIALSEFMMMMKRDTSKWMKDHAPGFAWQDGYFAFSLGESMVDAARAYIANQKAHHQTQSFQDEVRAFLRKYAIEFDERYVWA